MTARNAGTNSVTYKVSGQMKCGFAVVALNGGELKK